MTRWHLEADLRVPSLLRLRLMGLVLDTLGGARSAARELPRPGEGGSWGEEGGGGAPTFSTVSSLSLLKVLLLLARTIPYTTWPTVVGLAVKILILF